MSDVDFLPPIGRRPPFPPSEEGFTEVVRRARRRRFRQLGVGSGAVATVALAVALLGQGNLGSVARLGVKPDDTAHGGGGTTVGSSPLASPQPAPAARNTRGPAATARPGSAPPRSPGSTPQLVPPAESGVAVSTPAAAAPVAGPHLAPPLVRDIAPPNNTFPCIDVNSVVQGWCVEPLSPPYPVYPGVAAEWRWAFCRTPGFGAGQLTFDTNKEIDFAVSQDAQQALWQWSTGYTFPPELHVVLVPDSYCVRWTLTYDATDQQGKPLAPGDYYMQPSSYAHEVSPFVTSTGFQVTDQPSPEPSPSISVGLVPRQS